MLRHTNARRRHLNTIVIRARAQTGRTKMQVMVPRTALHVRFGIGNGHGAILIETGQARIAKRTFKRRKGRTVNRVRQYHAVTDLGVSVPIPDRVIEGIDSVRARLMTALKHTLGQGNVIGITHIGQISHSSGTITRVTTRQILGHHKRVRQGPLNLIRHNLKVTVNVTMAHRRMLGTRVKHIVSTGTTFSHRNTQFRTHQMNRGTHSGNVAQISTRAVHQNVLKRGRRINLRTQVRQLSRARQADNLMHARRTCNYTLGRTFSRNTPLAIQTILGTRNGNVTVRSLTLATTRGLMITTLNCSVNTVLVRLRTPNRTQATFTTRQPALVTNATLVLIVTPRNTSLLSVAGSGRSARVVHFPTIP